ncbi:fimbrial protein [Pseudomonas sp. PDNC002]|uniref:fimbrial protein n=1 Tax=Pseudomonas sp. PDNC002 TaxID=2811422 RepID=UPI001963CDBA|nr:fimbrial protein [Pseudomonas sp. PDNC002]QRY77846.1 fimbrial protein [Pseudomonas sp. PDNC002]
MQFGRSGGYDPETTFWRCLPSDAISEEYSMHGHLYPYGFLVPGYGGNVYSTMWADVGIRITNLGNNQPYTKFYQQRPIDTSVLDKDDRGYVLVKAKNLSAVRVELIRINPTDNSNMGYEDKAAGAYDMQTYPLAYVIFSGPGTSGYSPNVGVDSTGDTTGFPGYAWIGSIGLYGNISVRRTATCSITNVTPVVVFAPILLGELNSGGSRTQPFTIESNCQAGAITNTAVADSSYGKFTYNSTVYTCSSGMAYSWLNSNTGMCLSNSGTALGILPASANSIAQAQALNLKSAGGGLTYLLSDNYGLSSDVATGVGIQILRKNVPINLLSSSNSAAAATEVAANNAGWYRLVDSGTSSLGGNKYSEVFQATLKKLPGVTVTPGKISATGRVLIRVQ